MWRTCSFIHSVCHLCARILDVLECQCDFFQNRPKASLIFSFAGRWQQAAKPVALSPRRSWPTKHTICISSALRARDLHQPSPSPQWWHWGTSSEFGFDRPKGWEKSSHLLEGLITSHVYGPFYCWLLVSKADLLCGLIIKIGLFQTAVEFVPWEDDRPNLH